LVARLATFILFFYLCYYIPTSRLPCTPFRRTPGAHCCACQTHISVHGLMARTAPTCHPCRRVHSLLPHGLDWAQTWHGHGITDDVSTWLVGAATQLISIKYRLALAAAPYIAPCHMAVTRCSMLPILPTATPPTPGRRTGRRRDCCSTRRTHAHAIRYEHRKNA